MTQIKTIKETGKFTGEKWFYSDGYHADKILVRQFAWLPGEPIEVFQIQR